MDSTAAAIAARLAMVLALGGLLAGCEHPSSCPLEALRGTIVSGDPFIVLPSRAWRKHSERNVWFLASEGALVCHVIEPPREPVFFTFLPEHPSPEPCLTALWNGKDVTGRSWQIEGGELQVEISPEMLPPGTHFLTLRPCRSQPSGESAARTFAAIGYRYADSSHELRVEELARSAYLADFLTFGVTGSYGREKLDGFVFDGPRSISIELPQDLEGRFVTTVQNSSHGVARFRMTRGGKQQQCRLDPHERRVMELALTADAAPLTFAVEGPKNGFFLWGAPFLDPPRPSPRTSIVLITLDTTRRDALGVYGGDRGVTPHLDELAGSATVFERAYAPAPWTLPSHASIFTGLYPSKHGAGVAADHLESRFETLPELLRRHGYLTAGFGGGMLTSYRFGVGQGFARFHDPDGFESVAAPLTDRALQFLESQRTSPLFLFVNYFDPHFPYAAPASFQQALGAPALREPIEGLPDWPEALSGSSDAWSRIVSGAVPATAEAVSAVRASYLAEVAFMDQEIGRLLAALQSAELFDRALIVVAADHGEFLGEGGFFDHSARLDPELVEIPLIIKWPHQHEGRRVDAVTSLVDLFPTMLRIAGIRPPEQDGIALAPRMSDAVQRRGRILIEEHAADFHHLAAGMKLGDHTYSLLENGFRQILWEDGSECYRLEPSGWQRRTCPPRWPTSREWLREASMLDGAFQPREGRIGLTNHERESLRALGYIR